MFEETRQFVEYMQGLPEDQRSWATTWLIINMIGQVTLYVITGLVVWALGRRMIQAATFAWKETRREPA